MNDKLDEPLRTIMLGGTRLSIASVGLGKYLLLRVSDGSPIAGPLTRRDVDLFAQDLLEWVRDADAQA